MQAVLACLLVLLLLGECTPGPTDSKFAEGAKAYAFNNANQPNSGEGSVSPSSAVATCSLGDFCAPQSPLSCCPGLFCEPLKSSPLGGQYCVPASGSCCSSGQCCGVDDGFHCRPALPEQGILQVCCLDPGNKCSTSRDCCTGTCQGSRCCQTETFMCNATTPCCEGLFCVGGTCQTRSDCQIIGEVCTQSFPCCKGIPLLQRDVLWDTRHVLHREFGLL